MADITIRLAGDPPSIPIRLRDNADGTYSLGTYDYASSGASVTPITPTHTAPTMSTTSATVLAANASRRYALITNDSDVVVYINLTGVGVANTGIRLAASGGTYEMSGAYGNLTTGIIRGIAASGSGKVLLVTEGV